MRSFLGLVVLLSAAAAQAQPVCTFPTATLSASLSGRAAPLSPAVGGIINIEAAWDLEAVANPNVSCANLATGLGLYLTPAANNDAGAAIGAGLPTSVSGVPGTGTTPIEADLGGNFIIWGEFDCNCGILGTNQLPVPSNSVLVPPTIVFPPQPLPNLAIYPVPWDGTNLPVGDGFSLAPAVGAVLCPGDTLTFALTGAGVNATATVPATTECTMNNGFSATIPFTPAEVGTLTLTATLDGAVSNAVTYNVVAGASGSTTSGTGGTTGSSTSGTGGTTGSSTSSGSKGGGCTVVGGGFSLWALLGMAGSFRRRKPGSSS